MSLVAVHTAVRMARGTYIARCGACYDYTVLLIGMTTSRHTSPRPMLLLRVLDGLSQTVIFAPDTAPSQHSKKTTWLLCTSPGLLLFSVYSPVFLVHFTAYKTPEDASRPSLAGAGRLCRKRDAVLPKAASGWCRETCECTDWYECTHGLPTDGL